MVVVLRRHRRDLPLRRTEGLHPEPTLRCVDRHKATVWAIRLTARRHLNTLAQLQQQRGILIGGQHIPAAFEQRQRPAPVRDIHLLGTQRQRHVAGPGAQRLHRQLEGAGARGAGVLDVPHRQADQADLVQNDLSGNRCLADQGPLSHPGIEHLTNIIQCCAGIGQRYVERLVGQRLEGTLQMTPELGHPDADYIDWCAHLVLILHAYKVKALGATTASRHPPALQGIESSATSIEGTGSTRPLPPHPRGGPPQECRNERLRPSLSHDGRQRRMTRQATQDKPRTTANDEKSSDDHPAPS